MILYLSLLDGIFIWLFLWFLFWGVFVYYLRPRGVDYTARYIVTSVYFLAAAAIIAHLFWDYFRGLISGFTIMPFYALGVALIFDAALYFFVNRHKDVSDFIASHHQTPFLLMDYRYIIAKLSNIAFQQSLIILLALLLSSNGFRMSGITVAFAILFVSGHIPMLRLDGRGIGSFFIVAAACAALFFPFLILRVPYGFVYAYIIHQAFYMLSGLFSWFYFKKIDGDVTRH
ncbi:MAG: hypothetical protein HZC14_03725 [Candidatus Niyogibacteria bacterium]|nr:hypothetical protein [Candidatus Niyogibacteria bacterium]